MRSPKDRNAVEVRTATFSVLLKRATLFFDIAEAAPHLYKMHKIWNSLIHHRGSVDILEVNLLLVEHIFPLVERLSKVDKYLGPRISPDTWKNIRELGKLSVDALSSQLAKKLAYHLKVLKRLSGAKISVLLASAPEKPTRGADLIESGLICPACKNEAPSAFQDYDVKVEDGTPVAAYSIPSMMCRVCGLELDESEIQHIITNFEEFMGNNDAETEFWMRAIEVDNLANYY